MRPLSAFGAIAAGMLILLSAPGMALAQDDSQGASASDPPARVARLSDIEGSVSVEPAGTDSWATAVRNRPLTLGDKLWSDQNSRAELDIGTAAIRLGSTTGISFLNLDAHTAQMQVTAGTVIVHVREPWSGGRYEIDTPNLALTLVRTGTYRVEVNDAGDTTIVKVVASGEALVSGEDGQYYRVAAQQSATFTGTSRLTADYATLGAPDPLDEWALQREQQEQQEAALAQQYLPPDMVGAEDLGSDDGTWQDTPDWGYAWFPDVAADWAPYTTGSWAWVSPWGWTWVDDEPWGFAPFHYGRWGRSGSRWCWIPGPRGRRPVYAPALVGWLGGPHGVARSAGVNVGWFPLGPRDLYVPGNHASLAYVRAINFANARKIDAAYIANVYAGRSMGLTYANSQVPGGVTIVSHDVFESALLVGPHRILVPQQVIAGLRPTTTAPAIIPLEQSVLGAGRLIDAPPRAIVDRPVVARLPPPRAPISFAIEQIAIRANEGRPLAMTDLAHLRPNIPAAAVRLESPPQYYYRATSADAVVRAQMQEQERAAARASAAPHAFIMGNTLPSVPIGQQASQREQRLASPAHEVARQRFEVPWRQERVGSPRFHTPAMHARSAPPRAAPARAQGRPAETRPPSQPRPRAI